MNPSVPPPTEPPTILVVDDNRDTADTMAAVLESPTLRTVAVYSAQAALDLLDARGDVRLVVSDIRMPDIDGFDFLRVVRHRFPSMPMVLTTGLPITDDDVVPRDAKILRQPVAVETLRRAVEEALGEGVGKPAEP